MIGKMKLCLGVLCIVLLAPCARLEGANGGGGPSPSTKAIKPFLGRWDLTVRARTRVRPSWIQISETRGEAEGLMVGFFGHATPTGKIKIANGMIQFTAPPDAGYHEGAILKGRLHGGEVVGTVTNPAGIPWHWVGHRAPSLKRTGAPKWGKPIRLFNGKNLDGWKFLDPSKGGIWKVEDGTLVKQGIGSELISASKFKDFKLHIEFNCGPKSNSGVYLRGRYEVQIETDSAADPPNRRMGAIYGFIAPEPPLPRTPNVWRTYDITLIGRTVTVVADGRTVINHREIPGITGGALNSNEGMPGPIYLQGSEEGRVAFRNIVITPAE